MKKFITLATAGIFLLGLQGAMAQKEVQPPAVPPLLEGSKPLASPETKEPAAPKQAEAEKAKSKAKAGPKSKKKAARKKNGKQKKAPKAAKKKSSKTAKKKHPAAEHAAPSGPDE